MADDIHPSLHTACLYLAGDGVEEDVVGREAVEEAVVPAPPEELGEPGVELLRGGATRESVSRPTDALSLSHTDTV